MTLCKSARSAIQLFYIHYRKYFAIILNPAVYLSSARVSIFHTLVPLLRSYQNDRKVGETIFHYKSMGAFGCNYNHSLDPICPKT